MPALLSELHAVIPSHNNHFMWAGPDLELANFYGEGDLLVSISTDANATLSGPFPK